MKHKGYGGFQLEAWADDDGKHYAIINPDGDHVDGETFPAGADWDFVYTEAERALDAHTTHIYTCVECGRQTSAKIDCAWSKIDTCLVCWLGPPLGPGG